MSPEHTAHSVLLPKQVLYQLSYGPKKNVLLPAQTVLRVENLPKHSARTAPNCSTFPALIP